MSGKDEKPKYTKFELQKESERLKIQLRQILDWYERNVAWMFEPIPVPDVLWGLFGERKG